MSIDFQSHSIEIRVVNDGYFESTLFECFQTINIENSIDESLRKMRKDRIEYFNAIYKNIIMNKQKPFSFYKISANDEIWIGQIENYLQYDDVIVELFVCGSSKELVHLIVKYNCYISSIISMLAAMIPDIVNIKLWNMKGDILKHHQMIDYVDPNAEQYYRILLSFDSNQNGFEECCQLYNQYLIDNYLYHYLLKSSWPEEKLRKHMKIYGNIHLLKKSFDSFFDFNLKWFPPSLIKCKFLFFSMLIEKIFHIYQCDWKLKMQENQTGVPFFMNSVFNNYFRIGLCVAVLECIKSLQCNETNMCKSIKEIAFDAVNCLNDSRKNRLYLSRLIRKQLLLTHCNYVVMTQMVDNLSNRYGLMVVTRRGYQYKLLIPKHCQSILQMKESIAWQAGVSVEDLFFIESGGYFQRKDKDSFEIEKYGRQSIEIVSNTSNVEILSRIGRGAFGEIFLCRDKISQSMFALKVPIQDEGIYRDISIPIRMGDLSKINNYHGLYKNEEGKICVAMNLMSNGDLTSHLQRRGWLSEDEIAKICYHILIEINEIHKHGIIHMDIKCDNIGLDEYFNARLIDFGRSECSDTFNEDRFGNGLKKTTYRNGTSARYMAPELLNGEPYSNMIDIWSLGATVITMITGNIPYPNMEHVQAAMKIAKTKEIEFESPQPLSQQFTDFIGLCLKPNPIDRATSTQLIHSKFIQNFLNRSS